MSVPNVEYVESVLKLALIERRTHALAELGGELTDTRPAGTEWATGRFMQCEELESMLRSPSKLRAKAEAVLSHLKAMQP